MYRDKFVVVRDSSESREENPIFILTLHDDLVLDKYGELVIDNYGELDKEKLLFRVFKNEKALKAEKVSSFLFWFILGSAILALGVFLADSFDIFKASSEMYLATLSVFAFLLFTNILLSVIYSGSSSSFFTKLFNQEDFFTVKEYVPEHFDNWMMTVKDFEESNSEKDSPAENYINNVLILAHMRKKNRGRKITPKWEDLISDKDEKYLEFTVDKATNF